MRVLALGGAGDFGLRVVRLLASNEIVSEITVAGRSLEKAQSAAAATGEKAKAVSVDISDHGKLVSLARDSDLLLNTAGPEWEVVPKALQAAIDAGTDYCDLCAHGPTFERALALDSAARASGITALMGMGQNPGLTSLLMAHAARQLDQTTEVIFCDFYSVTALAGWRDRLQKYIDTGKASAAWQMIMKWGTPPFRVYHGGALKAVESKAEEVQSNMPGNGQIPAVETGGIEHITIPRSIPGVQNVHTLLSWYPFQLNDSYRDIGAQAAKGELGDSQATQQFIGGLIKEIDRRQTLPKDFVESYMLWAAAIGTKAGKKARYSCWPASTGWLSTVHAMSLGALKVLKGEVNSPGVLSPESCLDPLPFFRDVARSALREEPGELLHEAWQTL